MPDVYEVPLSCLTMPISMPRGWRDDRQVPQQRADLRLCEPVLRAGGRL
jgi:hypothetical protein